MIGRHPGAEQRPHGARGKEMGSAIVARYAMSPTGFVSFGLGPVSSSPRLARTEQLSTIRSRPVSGCPRSMPASME